LRKICVEHLRPGMVVGTNIHGFDGSIIYAKGFKLDQESIDILVDLGLGYVNIQDSGDKEADRKDLLRRCGEYVHGFFQYVNPESELFNEIFRQTVKRTFKAVRYKWDLPCAAEIKAQDVEHLTDAFSSEKARAEEIVKYETELVSFPDIYFRIQEVLEDVNSSAEDIARVVSTDVALSAKLLKLINSPFYGLPHKVDSISRAIPLLGSKEVSALALGVSTIDFFQNIPPELMDMKTFWIHSLRCSVYARLIASRVQEVETDRFFTAGLLHDVGRLIIFKNLPYASVQVLLFARSNMLPLVEAENRVLGYDHTDIGELLLREWSFPDALLEMIKTHHVYEDTGPSIEASIVQLADNLAIASEIPFGGKFVLPGMRDDALERLGFTAKDLQELFDLHDQYIQGVLDVYL